MNHVRTKILIGGAILAVAVGYLAYRGVAGGASYYISVDEYLSDPSVRDHRVRLYGVVGTENFSEDAGQTAFDLAGKTHRIRVRYHGSIPDTFRVGGNVVVAGRMGSDGIFVAQELLTKCASKYEKRMEKERPA